jgi:hypothetical protein
MKARIRSIRQSLFLRISGTALPGPRAFLLVVAGVAAAVPSPIARGQCPDGCNGTNTYQGFNAAQVQKVSEQVTLSPASTRLVANED